MAIDPAGISSLQMELAIDAAPAAVWQSLTTNIGQWWPADFYTGGTESQRTFLLESRPGGRMCEEWQDGGGVLWATVIGLEPQVRLQVVGHTFPNWGGPSQWYGTWTLTAQQKGTLLTFEEYTVGRVAEGATGDKEKGWQFLWRVLKAHAEGKRAPGWDD